MAESPRNYWLGSAKVAFIKASITDSTGVNQSDSWYYLTSFTARTTDQPTTIPAIIPFSVLLRFTPEGRVPSEGIPTHLAPLKCIVCNPLRWIVL